MLQSHASTWHDAGVAVLTPSGQIVALSSERVGNRVRHDGDPSVAYQFLRSRLVGVQSEFGGHNDHFRDTAKDGLDQVDHHLYHASATFFSSGFRDAAILVVDGQGPQSGLCMCNSIWKGSPSGLEFIAAPNSTTGAFNSQSLGHFYTAVSALAGMDQLHEEGKTMGLAAHGSDSQFVPFLRRFLEVDGTDGYQLATSLCDSVFSHTFGPRFYDWPAPTAEHASVWNKFLELRSTPMRATSGAVTVDDMNVAFAGQLLLVEAMVSLSKLARRLTGCRALCLAGGVALNCSANRAVLDASGSDPVFVFPAAGDDGQAYGKLLWSMHREGLELPRFTMPYFGPEYSPEEISAALDGAEQSCGEKITICRNLSMEQLVADAVGRLKKRHVVGWFRGRSECGPRALGHRSILADPRPQAMLEYINSRVKGREWYRPLAPIVLAGRAAEFFDLPVESPYMLFSASVREDKKALIPAITHVDGTARLQTVTDEQEPVLAQLLRSFDRETGIPVLLNTSLNTRGVSIAETPEDAVKTFLASGLDALYLENHVIFRKPQEAQFEAFDQTRCRRN